MMALKVAVICESSRRVASAFEALGHYAVSCDLKPAEQLGNHIQGDARLQDWRGFDLIIAHPDCTYLCNSGVCWLALRDGRPEKMKAAGEFFKWCLELPCEHIAVENPIPHKYALAVIGRKYDQIIQPYYFGEMESKATCLWLKGLPPLMAQFTGGENIKQTLHRLPPGPERAANRARTFQGIANAMADQWSRALLESMSERQALGAE